MPICCYTGNIMCTPCSCVSKHCSTIASMWNAVWVNSCVVICKYIKTYFLLHLCTSKHVVNSSFLTNSTWLYNYVPLHYHIHICYHTNTSLSSIVIAYQFILLHLHIIVHCSSNTSICTALICTIHHMYWCVNTDVFSGVLLCPCALQVFSCIYGHLCTLFFVHVHALGDTRTSVCHVLLLHQYIHVSNSMKTSMWRCADYLEN